jgi:putative endonuclease
MPKNGRFFVYVMTNRPRSHVLYTGITGDLPHRVFQHKSKLLPGFTSRYNLTRLVYYEEFLYPDAAINRGKEIKGWRRSKKICLIELMNPHWSDLAGKWTDIYKPQLKREENGDVAAPREIPRSSAPLGMTQSWRTVVPRPSEVPAHQITPADSRRKP